jgi:hypothetical protein
MYGFGVGGILVGWTNHTASNCHALGWACHLGICCDGCTLVVGISVGSGGIPQLGGMVQLGCHCHHCHDWVYD